MGEVFCFRSPEEGDVDTNGRIFTAVGQEDPAGYYKWRDTVEENAIIQGAMTTHLNDEKDLCTLAPQAERDAVTRLIESRHQLRRMITASHLVMDSAKSVGSNNQISGQGQYYCVNAKIQNNDTGRHVRKRLCCRDLDRGRSLVPLFLEE